MENIGSETESRTRSVKMSWAGEFVIIHEYVLVLYQMTIHTAMELAFTFLVVPTSTVYSCTASIAWLCVWFVDVKSIKISCAMPLLVTHASFRRRLCFVALNVYRDRSCTLTSIPLFRRPHQYWIWYYSFQFLVDARLAMFCTTFGGDACMCVACRTILRCMSFNFGCCFDATPDWPH